jgi:hypothetical protein
MADEIPSRPGGEAHAGNAPGERGGEQSALQVRAAFLQNWDWQLVISLNQTACERGRAQHGHNSETHERVRQQWEGLRPRELIFKELLEFLRTCHRDAPFLFFNGNTFAEVARRSMDALLAEFPLARRREAASLAAHYVAGVLDEESLVLGLDSLTEPVDFRPGDRVKTLRGSMSGTMLRVLPDGRVLWRADSGAELTALPESVIRQKKK